MARWLMMALMAASTGSFAAREIARLDFAETGAEVAADSSGFNNHGEIAERAEIAAPGSVECRGEGWVTLPAGEALWGPEAERGSVSVWVKPGFDPARIQAEQWAGYNMIFYAMAKDGNGLPDGYDEIGIWSHGPNLRFKISRSTAGAFCSIDTPLKKGEWTHLALCWKPGHKAAYVNGALVDEDSSEYDPPRLDAFPAMLGQHPSSERWAWDGQLADTRLFDDALTAEDVAALAATRQAGSDALQPRVLADLDWAEVWIGKRQATARIEANRSMEAFCEVLNAEGRTAGRPVSVAAAGTVAVPYEIAHEGRSRVNLVVRDPETDRDVAGASAFVSVPQLAPLLSNLDRGVGKLEVLLNREWTPRQATEALMPRQQAFADELAALVTAREEAPGAEAWRGLIDRAQDLEKRLSRVWRTAMIYSEAGRDGELPEYGLGVDHALVKTLKHDAFGGEYEAPIQLKAARHEYEAAQLVIFGLEEPVKQVTVETGDLTGPGGAVIEAASVAWNRVGWVETRKPTYEVRHVGLWPDPLLPGEPFDVAANDFESVWLTVYVPPDAAAGDYEGTVTVRPAEGQARTVPLKLHVWDFALPEKLSLVSAFGLNSLGSRGGEIDVDKYVENAHRHRISLGFPGEVFKAASVKHPSFDFGGQELRLKVKAEGQGLGKLFVVLETQGVKGRRVLGPIGLRDGAWTEASLPTGAEEQPTSVRLEYRAEGPVRLTVGEIRVGDRVFDAMQNADWWLADGPWTSARSCPDGLQLDIGSAQPGEPFIEKWPGVTRFAAGTPADTEWHMDFTEFDARVEKYLERGINCIVIPVPGCPRDISEEHARAMVAENGLARIAKAYQDHLEEKGWLDYAYTYVADEPHAGDYGALNVVMGTIKRSAPKLRNLITARSFPAELEYVDIWCPEVYSFDPRAAAEEQAKGKQVWWYPAFSTRHPFPDFWIDYPLIDCRVIFWLTWKHKLDGLLYWSISNWWRADPWTDPMTFPGANGDGTLVYPGPDGAPVDSIRWEAIRDGSEDYEYFVLLRDALAKVRASGNAGDTETVKLMARAQELLAIEDGVAKSWREWSPAPGRLLAARDEMGQCIEKLLEAVR